MDGHGGAEVKVVFGVSNFSGSVAPERREMEGHGGAEIKIECGGLIEKLASSAQPSGSIQIPRVPRHKRAGNEKAYDPTVISIGPYHRGREGLEDMEKIKVEYLRKLVSRDPAADEEEAGVVQRCLECVQKREEDARRYYDSKEIAAISSSQFVEMMVLDGCFILGLLISYGVTKDAEGPVYSTEWFSKHVRTDLLLLENQIPYFILEELFQLINVPELNYEPYTKGECLVILAVYYIMEKQFDFDILYELFVQKKDASRGLDEGHPVHLLHLYYLYLSQPPYEPIAKMSFKYLKRKLRIPLNQCLLRPFICFWLCFGRGNCTDVLPSPCVRRDRAAEGSVRRRIACAKDLRKVWVRFEKKDDTHSFIDVTFKDGTLEIPQIWVEQATEPQLQNLIALEQSRPDLKKKISSYAWLMDNLISTEEDVVILQKEKILETNLGSEKAVATYFNKLCRGQNMDFDGHPFKDIFDKLNEHTEDPSNRWGAQFRESYFSSPWVAIALATAVLVFVMTLLQTILSTIQFKA